MTNQQQSIHFPNAQAEVFVYDNGTAVREAHVMVHATNYEASFHEQLNAILDTYTLLREGQLNGYDAVFKRYYLSDATNQADMVYDSDCSGCALSVIQQSPLDGSKVALWAYMMTDVNPHLLKSGLYEVKHGGYRHLWNGSASNTASDSERQMRLLFNEYVMQLAQEGCTLANNCLRTWIFVRDIDNNYAGVVRARNQIFFTQGLTTDTHFIASTGISGQQANAKALVQMDTYAIDGITPEQIHYLYAPTHLNRTSDYGVSFERGAYADYGDRRHVFISGTASIDNKGNIVHPGDIVRQTDRMLENIAALLGEAECTWDDVCEMTVYLRDIADYGIVSHMFADRFPGKPYVIVLAPVCRPGWLVETECMAVKSIATDNPTF